MSAVPQEPSSLQRAALTLHALAEPDREWMLRSLSAAQRGLLQPLVQELDALGIPRDARLLEDIGARSPRQDAAPDPLATLADADPRLLAAFLCTEPARVAAAVLAASGSALRERLLACLAPERIAQLDAAAEVSAPALSRAVIAQVATRLQAQRADAKSVSLWRRVGRLLAARGERR